MRLNLLWEFLSIMTKYFWSAVNKLENGRKISDLTKSHDTELNFFDINGKLE